LIGVVVHGIRENLKKPYFFKEVKGKEKEIRGDN